MESPIIPLGDKIVILPQEEGEQTYGNIVVPDMGKEKPEIGVVLASGPGRVTTNGVLIKNKIKKGEIVIVPNFGAKKIEIKGKSYTIASENDVLGTIDLKQYKNE